MPRIPTSEPWQHRFVEANGLRFHTRFLDARFPSGGPRP